MQRCIDHGQAQTEHSNLEKVQIIQHDVQSLFEGIDLGLVSGGNDVAIARCEMIGDGLCHG